MELIGTVGVDSGTMYIGDPCYIKGDGRLHSDAGWSMFCEEVLFTKQFEESGNTEIGRGMAIVTDTAYGDGSYPVYVTKTREGRTASVTIVFVDEKEDL